MRKSTIDVQLKVRLPHSPGQMARFAQAVADHGGVLGEISTERLGENDVIRYITIEASDEGHAERLITAVSNLESIDVLAVVDRAFGVHELGKIKVQASRHVDSIRMLRYVYTPGVARVAQAIQRAPERIVDWTWAGRAVGIFTNGTRVLGLGNIGPLASLPVMEGKAMLYAQLVGLNAVPIVLDAEEPEKMIDIIQRSAIGFGAIHLEDIRTPDCFAIEAALKASFSRPVFHDDQHGTAVAALAALLNVGKKVGKSLKDAVVGQIGLGAAGTAIAHLMHSYGVKQVLVYDPNPVAQQQAIAFGAVVKPMKDLMAQADVIIATTGRPGLIEASMVRPGQIVFALSNPDPEIDPNVAYAAGAAFAGDGRSINNALAYPGIMRGALDARTKCITNNMLIAAAHAIASCAQTDEIVPSPLDTMVHQAVIQAVVNMAEQEQLTGTARFAAPTP